MNSNPNNTSSGSLVVIGVVIALLLTFVFSAGVRMYRGSQIPTLDQNTAAYTLLLIGLGESNYAAAKSRFDQAYNMSTDAQLSYLAEFFAKGAQLALNSGIQSKQEADSFTGSVKAFARGFNAPLDGLDAWALIFKQAFGDFDNNCTAVDNRYNARMREYYARKNWRDRTPTFSWTTFLCLLLPGFILATLVNDKVLRR